MTRKRRRRVYKRSVLGTLSRLFRKFLNWAFDSIRNLLLIVFAVFLLGQWLQIDFIGKLRQKIDTERPLKENEAGRLSGDINAKRIVLQERDKKTKIYEGVRKFEASKLRDGEVKVKVKNKGFGIEPGFVVGAGEGLRLGADIQYAYWKRWGLTLGGTVPTERRRLDTFRGHIGVAYSPYWKFAPSTSLWGGVDTNKSPVFGIRTEF